MQRKNKGRKKGREFLQIGVQNQMGVKNCLDSHHLENNAGRPAERAIRRMLISNLYILCWQMYQAEQGENWVECRSHRKNYRRTQKRSRYREATQQHHLEDQKRMEICPEGGLCVNSEAFHKSFS